MVRRAKTVCPSGREVWWKTVTAMLEALVAWSTDDMLLRQQLCRTVSQIREDENIGVGIVVRIRGGGEAMTLKKYPQGIFACCAEFVICCEEAVEDDRQRIVEKLRKIREGFDAEMLVISSR